MWLIFVAIENEKNRDIFLKFCFMYFLNHILRVLGINETIVDIPSTEMITFKKNGKPELFDNFLDFKAITKSGKILIFEFKKNSLRTNDLKQAYEYYTWEYCKSKADVHLIFVVISNGGRIKEYTKLDLIFHPRIIKTKKINKQKDLNALRDKFFNNKKLTIFECSLLIALPLFDLDENESDIVEETCNYIRYKKHCILEEKLDEVIIASYLNIVEYIEEEKQDVLLEMIGMAEKVQTLVDQIENRGIKKGEKSIICTLLETFSIDVVSELIHKDKNEILNLIEEK